MNGGHNQVSKSRVGSCIFEALALARVGVFVSGCLLEDCYTLT